MSANCPQEALDLYLKRPLVKVECGDRTGVLLGGHDTHEVFIRCQCSDCARLPCTAFHSGGCIWPVSRFEAHGGRASHKKWRDSIRIAGGGDTVGKWIEQRCRELGAQLVGQRVEVFWPKDCDWFKGTVTGFTEPDSSKQVGFKHTIQYDDGDQDEVHMALELFRRLPPGPADAGPLPAPKPAPADLLATADAPRSADAGAQHAGADKGGAPTSMARAQTAAARAHRGIAAPKAQERKRKHGKGLQTGSTAGQTPAGAAAHTGAGQPAAKPQGCKASKAPALASSEGARSFTAAEAAGGLTDGSGSLRSSLPRVPATLGPPDPLLGGAQERHQQQRQRQECNQQQLQQHRSLLSFAEQSSAPHSAEAPCHTPSKPASDAQLPPAKRARGPAAGQAAEAATERGSAAGANKGPSSASDPATTAVAASSAVIVLQQHKDLAPPLAAPGATIDSTTDKGKHGEVVGATLLEALARIKRLLGED